MTSTSPDRGFLGRASRVLILAVLGAAPLLSGCVAARVTGAAVSATGTVVAAGAHAGARVLDAATPDGDSGH